MTTFRDAFRREMEKLAAAGAMPQVSPTGQTKLPPISTQQLQQRTYQVPQNLMPQPITGPTQPGAGPQGSGGKGLIDTVKTHNALYKGKVDFDKMRRKAQQDEEFDTIKHQQRMTSLSGGSNANNN